MVEQTCGISRETFLELCEAWTANSRPGPDHRAGLQRRLDPAQRRRAVHPHRRDPAAAAGQHGPPGRRHHGAARSRQHPGVDRHPDAVQPAARLPADAQRAGPPEPGGVGRQRAPSRVQGLLGPGRRLRHQPAQGLLGRGRDGGQRLLLRLPAPDHRRPRHLPHGAGHDRRQGQGLLPARPEPRRRLRPRKAQRLGMANLDWLVVRDLFEIESATFWKNSPEIETGEIVPEECRTEVFLLPAASHVEKEGTFTQTQRMLQWREKAVEPRRRLPLRAVVLLPPGPDDPGAAGRLHPGARPSAAGPGLGLPRPRGDRGPQRRGRAEGDQRLRGRHRAGRCRPSPR